MDFIASCPWNWLWLSGGRWGAGGPDATSLQCLQDVLLTVGHGCSTLSLPLPPSGHSRVFILSHFFFYLVYFLCWSCSSTNFGTVSRRQHLFLVSSTISRLTPRRALLYTRTLADDMSGEDWGWGVALVSLLCCPGLGYFENKHVI